MPGADETIFVYTTFSEPQQAKEVGGALVQERLAACVNIFPGMISIYRWEGALEEGAETAMLVKTRRSLEADVIARLKALHPFDEPAILVVPIDGGSASYLGWIRAETERS